MRRVPGPGGSARSAWLPSRRRRPHQVRQQYGEPGPTARAARLHGAHRAVQHRGRLGDRVALHVDQHQRRALLRRAAVRQRVEHLPPALARARRRRRGPRWRRWPRSSEPRSPYSSRSSGSGSARRTFAARIRSRQALTTTRCSQVVTAASPRNDPARRYAATMPSCRPSAASSGLPMVRSATAQSRSRCRPKRTPNASRSPATCAAQQLGVGPDVGTVDLRHRAPPPRRPSPGTRLPTGGSEVNQTMR